MYKITYQKRNGVIFDRIRSTLPSEYIGETTSMGWTILNIQYGLNGKFYNPSDYYIELRKYKKRNKISRDIRKFVKRYATTFSLIILIPLYLFK